MTEKSIYSLYISEVKKYFNYLHNSDYYDIFLLKSNNKFISPIQQVEMSFMINSFSLFKEAKEFTTNDHDRIFKEMYKIVDFYNNYQSTRPGVDKINIDNMYDEKLSFIY